MEYSFPLPTNYVDGQSASRIFTLPPLVNCNTSAVLTPNPYIPKKPIPHNTKPYTSQLYNCSHSPSDPDYFQPFCRSYTPPSKLPQNLTPPYIDYFTQLPCSTPEQGCPTPDLLYFQFSELDITSFIDDTPTPPLNHWSVVIHTPNGCIPVGPYIATQAITVDNRGVPFQIVTINTENTPCYFNLSFYFHTNNGIVSYYSEPFMEVSNCIPTCTIQGIYPTNGTFAYDCNGNYYGYGITPPDETIPYINSIRIPASLFLERIEVNQDNERSYRSSIATASRTTTVYKLRSKHLPEYVIRQLQACLEAQTVLVNNIPFEGNFNLSRSNEIGCAWLLDIELTHKPCIDRYFSC